MSDTNAAPSSTEPSVLSEIVNEFHKLEEKVEHFIHPEHAQEVGAAAAGEQVAAVASAVPTSAITSDAIPGATSALPSTEGEPGNVATGVSVSAGSTPVQSALNVPSTDSAANVEVSGTPATGAEGGESPNAAATPHAGAATDAGAGDTGNIEKSAVTATSESNALASDAAGIAAAELPNAAASPAASQDAGNTASSAASALPSVATTAVSTSTGSAIRERLQAIKGHLAGFEESSVQKIVGELEAIERML